MHDIKKYVSALAIFAVLLAGAVCVVGSDNDNTDATSTYNVYYVVGDVTYSDTSDGAVTLSTIDDLGASVPAGKEFLGWSDGTSIYDAGTDLTITSNAIYTAMFGVTEYTVTFIYGEIVSTASYEYDDTVTVPTVTAPTGYDFAGWSNGTATLTEIPDVTADAVYVAVFVAEVIPEPVVTYYTVTFMVGTEEYLVETIESGKVAIAPYITGYTWDYDFDDAITADTTIEAVAIATPASEPDTIWGVDQTEFIIYFIVALAIVIGLILVARSQGFLGGVKK